MNFKHLLFSLFAISMLFACSSDDPMEQDIDIVNEFSFTIDGTDYSYGPSDITVTQDTTGTGIERLFLRVDDGDDTFTFNVWLTHDPGTYGLDWNAGEFFFLDIPVGEFYFLDAADCLISITNNDRTAMEFEATFEGTGTQALGADEVDVTNGVIKIKY